MGYSSISLLYIFGLSSINYLVSSQSCPLGWVDFEDSCYRFTRSPLKTRDEARQYCRAYNAADLVSVDTLEEHMLISKWLRNNDPLHRRWFTSGRDSGDNSWLWDGDGTQFSNIDALWNPDIDYNYWKYAAYNFSTSMNRWGLMKVDPQELLSFICEAPKEQIHQMVIMERGLDYGLMEADEDRLPRGPVFIMEPKAVVFDTSGRKQNNDVSLRCVASGYPAPTYTWFKKETSEEETEGRPIDPLKDNRYTQTDGTITINNPNQESDRGKYYCEARNIYGAVTSEMAQLGFGGITDFTKTRSPDRAKENWGKALSCDAPKATSGVFNFYWTRNSFPNFVEEDARVFVSYDGNLYISSVEKVDEALYSCNVQSQISSTGRTGPYFQLIIDPGSSGQKLLFPNNFPKSFPDAPLVGDNVRLECVSYGYPIPNYNWTRKGSYGDLPDGSYTTSYNRVLMLPKVRVEDIGEYLCTASNGLESISKSIALSIQAKPEFTIPLGNKVVDRDSMVTWTCEAFGIPEVTYTWLRNGKVLNENDLTGPTNIRYSIKENVLLIDSVQESDQGMFQCKASNQLGSTFSSGQLRVIRMKPSFTKHPMDSEMYAAYGGNATLPCRPEAAPLPEFTWRRNGQVVSTGGRTRLLPNGYLLVTNVGREDEGRYTCVARNSMGSDESEGVLQVLPPPRLIEYPRPVEVAFVNTSHELPCEAAVNEILDLAYIWQQNGLRIDPEIHHQFTLIDDRPGYLRINNVTLAEAGKYKCIAKTSIAKVYAEIELLVYGPPGAPGAVLAEDLNATSGRLHWSDGFANGRAVFAYTIEGRTNHNSTWVILATNVTRWRSDSNTMRKETALYGVLSPWSTYEFRVSAYNELGQGPPSSPSPQYNTEMDRPHVYPNNIGGGGGKTGSLTLTWDPLPPQEWNAPAIWYNIYYRPADSNAEPSKRNLKALGNIGMYALNVGDENYYKQYKVRVQAVNSMGEGPISPDFSIYSAESMPQIPPSSVKAVPFNSTSLRVSWVPLDLTREKIRGKLIGHRIKYWKNGEDPTTDSLILLSRGERPWSLIVGLQPNQEYYVSVMAYNDAGSGPDSEPFLARTYKAAPLRPPTSVRVRAISPTSVLVIWRGVLPSTEEEPISGYKVRYWEADKDYTSAKEVFKYLDGNDLEAVVPGLTPGKVYKLRVMAFSVGGDGKMSSPPWEFRVGEGVMSPLTSSSSKISSLKWHFIWMHLTISAIFYVL